jgi:hypothetical protein
VVAVLDDFLLDDEPTLLRVVISVADEAGVFPALTRRVSSRGLRVARFVALITVPFGDVIFDAHAEAPFGFDVRPPGIVEGCNRVVHVVFFVKAKLHLGGAIQLLAFHPIEA